jgi:hypothetical protein
MMGDQRYFGKASDRTLDAAIAQEWDSGLVCTAAILSRPCPLWVISGHWRVSALCPLYHRKRTLIERVGMSDLCQKQTSADISSVW